VATPLRVVLDTNVVVSGLLRRHASPPVQILDAVAAGLVRLVLDERILAEYAEVLVRPRLGLDPPSVARYLRTIQSDADAIVADALDLELSDPADCKFLEVAASGATDYLVTGNGRHFRPIRGTHHLAIMTPREFVAVL